MFIYIYSLCFRYGALSFGLVKHYVPENFGINAPTLFKKLAVRNVATVSSSLSFQFIQKCHSFIDYYWEVMKPRIESLDLHRDLLAYKFKCSFIFLFRCGSTIKATMPWESI